MIVPGWIVEVVSVVLLLAGLVVAVWAAVLLGTTFVVFVGGCVLAAGGAGLGWRRIHEQRPRA